MLEAFDPARLKAVVFDVDGTLYRQAPLRRAMALRLLGAHLGNPFRGLATLKILSAYRHGQEALRDAPGGGDLADAQLRFASTKSGVDSAEVAACVTRWMEEAPLDLLGRYVQPGAADFVRALKARGIKLAVLSDYPAEAKLKAMGMHGLFDVVLCAQAAEVSVFKPHPRGIQVAIERLGALPGEALYVGDRIDVDAPAAHAAGVACAILSSKPANGAATFRPVASFHELHTQLFSSSMSAATAAS